MTRRRLALVVAVCLLVTSRGEAFVVTDPAMTVEMSTIERIFGFMEDVSFKVDSVTRRIARSLAIFESVSRYLSTPQPLWRTRWVDPSNDISNDVRDAFNNGSASGEKLDRMMPALAPAINPAAGEEPEALPPALQQSMAAYEIMDSAIRTGVDATGTIRGSNRKVEVLVKAQQVLDILNQRGVGKSLEKLSSSVALGVQQRSIRNSIAVSTEDYLLARGLVQRNADADMAEWRSANMTVPPAGTLSNMADLVNTLSRR
jgi:hypothetical protein